MLPEGSWTQNTCSLFFQVICAWPSDKVFAGLCCDSRRMEVPGSCSTLQLDLTEVVAFGPWRRISRLLSDVIFLVQPSNILPVIWRFLCMCKEGFRKAHRLYTHTSMEEPSNICCLSSVPHYFISHLVFALFLSGYCQTPALRADRAPFSYPVPNLGGLIWAMGNFYSIDPHEETAKRLTVINQSWVFATVDTDAGSFSLK